MLVFKGVDSFKKLRFLQATSSPLLYSRMAVMVRTPRWVGISGLIELKNQLRSSSETSKTCVYIYNIYIYIWINVSLQLHRGINMNKWSLCDFCCDLWEWWGTKIPIYLVSKKKWRIYKYSIYPTVARCTTCFFGSRNDPREASRWSPVWLPILVKCARKTLGFRRVNGMDLPDDGGIRENLRVPPQWHPEGINALLRGY